MSVVLQIPLLLNFTFHPWLFARSHGDAGFQEAVTEKELWLLFVGICQAVPILPWEEREAAQKGGITNPPGQDSTAAGMLCGTGLIQIVPPVSTAGPEALTVFAPLTFCTSLRQSSV